MILTNPDLPMYCEMIFVAPRDAVKATMGDDSRQTMSGPKKVLGTTPGNS